LLQNRDFRFFSCILPNNGFLIAVVGPVSMLKPLERLHIDGPLNDVASKLEDTDLLILPEGKGMYFQERDITELKFKSIPTSKPIYSPGAASSNCHLAKRRDLNRVSLSRIGDTF